MHILPFDCSLFPLGPQPKFLRELRNVEAQIESQLTLTCQGERKNFVHDFSIILARKMDFFSKSFTILLLF